ncbi:Rab family GTPase YPT10 NDAI_0B04680 [Naumovozyma dairenensis CBS 421]|uniref:Uncharacterized protein n=1 Tax=Naumovozyma dairenensis (strain ATCC 10597 / BCRC 20456 / CBS 421 / NBRC 0211 / NRRL Y-12639) TaxID=1071378 RepID=G0W6U2_NAUDC|nr:hypothetical protein NDAI_0B04680 [Naumovozyma dairenensis CBS 421]CCD23503.1 hypothetical protein NDAI_0B04680 [Naumovozyma dairenensis CBS 421]
MNESPIVTYCCDLKVVLLGESSVGKTSIVTKISTGKFQKGAATIGAAFTTKQIQFNEIEENGVEQCFKVSIEIWDTAGQERYRSLTPMYYRNTDVALIVFDLTQEASLKKARSWIDELKSYLDSSSRRDKHISMILVANKVDLVAKNDGTFDINQYLENWDIPSEYPLKIVSAKTNEGINELFDDIIKKIPKDQFVKEDAQARRPSTIQLNSSIADNSTGCNC